MRGLTRVILAGAIVICWSLGVKHLVDHTLIGLLCMACSAFTATVWIISEERERD